MSRSDDPLGRRALFGTPPAAGPGDRAPGTGDSLPSGRRALFSSLTAAEPSSERPRSRPAAGPTAHAALSGDGAVATEGGRRRVLVECGSCRAGTPMSLARLAPQLIPSVWVPFRRMSRLMRCPHCHRLTWCRLDWSGLVSF